MRGARTAISTAAIFLCLCAPALAAHTGEGLAGESNDKVVTFASLGVLAFFVLVVVFGSFAQGRLERRKDARKAARAAQRVGW